jgi:hypothetical protein
MQAPIAAEENDEAYKQSKNPTSTDGNEHISPESLEEDSEIQKLVALLFSKKSTVQKNANALKSVPLLTSASRITLPPPVIFRRKRLTGPNERN